MDIDREEILKLFLLEAREQLDTLESTLLGLERRPRDPEILNALFRAAHTLKGNAAVVQLTSLEGFTHSLEDVLERVRGGVIPVTADLVSLLLRVVDAFRRIVPLAVAGVEDPQPEHDELLGWLASKHRGGRRVDKTSRDARGRFASAQPPWTTEPVFESESRTLRVDVQKLDRMLNLVGEITIARGRLGNLLMSGKEASVADLRDAHLDAERLYLELQEQLMRTRMVPLGPTFRRYGRVVRDLALASAKDVQLLIQGEDVEVDTAVVEGIKDPLMHMIRNAVDHGIERPEVRVARGKAARGTIVLSAKRDGGNILISMVDDGEGLDHQRILDRARATNLVGADEHPSDAALHKLIFAPGFSTASGLTEVSGRGIGMSVVQKNIEALRGSVVVSSEPHQGTTVTLRLPLTLAIIEGFSVTVGSETYVLPLESVVECVSLPFEEQRKGLAQGMIDLRGRALPYVRLADLFELRATSGVRESLVVLQHDGHQAGLAVDELQGSGQTVIKPLASLVEHAPAVAGCALLGNGRVALILDVPALFRAAAAEPIADRRGGSEPI